MRLIDARELIKNKVELPYNGGIFVVYPSQILSAPVIDAIPVVRCKDCRHLKVVNKEPVYAVCETINHTFYLWEEDTRESYCSWGERKDDE